MRNPGLSDEGCGAAGDSAVAGGAANEPPVAQPGAMRYERAIRVPAGAGQACAVLDAPIFPHAAPSLTDLRIFPAQAAAAGGGA